jgi:hypothetical protein
MIMTAPLAAQACEGWAARYHGAGDALRAAVRHRPGRREVGPYYVASAWHASGPRFLAGHRGSHRVRRHVGAPSSVRVAQGAFQAWGRGLRVGVCRIVVSEIETSNLLVNLV